MPSLLLAVAVVLGTSASRQGVAAQVASRQAAAPSVSCASTPSEERLPGVIAPMAGKHPVWLVDGSRGTWGGPKALVKSVWVLSGEAAGSLRVHGRRLDGNGVMAFRTSGDAPTTDALVMNDPRGHSVAPSGATPEIMKSYVFVPAYLIYPSPGCWELTVRVGGKDARIVLAVK